ncbi:MAG: Ig-like domain-containing protein [Lachnospiraceae bacterium]|nr:Ig-like domain-containing protein [Lachnospiraceae bacterium]
MRKIAVILGVVLAVQGIIPDTVLLASETAVSGNEAYTADEAENSLYEKISDDLSMETAGETDTGEPDTVSDRILVTYGIGIRTKSDIEKLHSIEEKGSVSSDRPEPATDKPVVYSLSTDGIDGYDTGVVRLPNNSSSYIAVYVFGRNIPDDGSLIPSFYYNGNRVSGGIKAVEQIGEGLGQCFILSKDNSDIWNDTASELALQLGVIGSDIQGDTGTRDVYAANGSVISNIGQYLLLTEDWVRDADETGIIGYTGDKEVFSESCTPVKYGTGGWYIQVKKTHDNAVYDNGNQDVLNSYKLYRRKNGKTEIYPESFYYDFNTSVRTIHSPLPDSLHWKDSWIRSGWPADLSKTAFTISPLDSMDIIASGGVVSGRSILGCITDSAEREAVSRLPFMRVVFYDENGTVSYKCYLLGDGSGQEEDDFEAVIAVKGKIALEAPGFTVAKWKSSDKSIASVSKKGVVTGKSAGKAVITAVGKGSSPGTKQYVIFVEKPVLKNTTLYDRDSFNINKKVSGVSRLKPVGYTSSNTGVIDTDSSGNVTVKKGGKAKLTINYQYGSVSATYTVKLPYIREDDISMLESKTKKLTLMNKSASEAYEFISSNVKAATVSDTGVVNAIAPGTATITLKINGEEYDAVKVTVKKPLIKQRAVKLKLNKTATLKIENKSKNTVLKSSDESVVTVNKNGRIKGTQKGTAIISTVINGTEYDTCAVTVD